MSIKGAALFVAGLVTAGLVQAADIEPAVVFDMGGKFDKSFNQGVYDGVERFKSETGIEYREFEVTNEAQREQALRRMAQRGAESGSRNWFRPGTAALEKVAKPNFQTPSFATHRYAWSICQTCSSVIVFKEHEGSFLVGACWLPWPPRVWQGWIRGRHGYPADSSFCLWL